MQALTLRALVCVAVLSSMPLTRVLADNLTGSEWQPLAVGGSVISPDDDLFVQFGGNGKVVGHGGCNQMFGGYSVTGVKVNIGPLAATRKACAGPVMKREHRFVQLLSRVEQFRREGQQLTLMDAAGNTVMKLRQRDAD